jgi:nodulation protein E
MMCPERIVITGVGGISSLGIDANSMWQAAISGFSGINTVELEADRYTPKIGKVPIARLSAEAEAALRDFSKVNEASKLDSIAQISLYSASQAIADAGLTASDLENRTAVVFGHSTGGTSSTENSYARFFGNGTTSVHPLTIPRAMVSASASAIAMRYGIEGVVFSVSSACSSSAHAIVQAVLLINAGLADIVIVGGSESITTPGFVSCWNALGAMSKTTCSPFSIDRDGMVLGDGGASLVLESLSSAESRGSKIYCELKGFGCSSDAYKLTQPRTDGAVKAMHQALSGSHFSAGEKIIVSAHGTGTPLNDSSEAIAIQRIFDQRVSFDDLRVFATKSAHGHLLGGSAALQIVLGILSLNRGRIPPIQNFSKPDIDCTLPFVIGDSLEFDAAYLLSNSFAFGGLNVSLLFARHGE